MLTLAPERAAGAETVSLDAQFPAVLIAARAGAPWAWTALHRCVAPPAIGYLHAAGARQPERVFGRIFGDFGAQARWFDGTEADLRLWFFKRAHAEVSASLGRAATGEMAILARLTQGPSIAAAVEQEHVEQALAAAKAPAPPCAGRRTRRGLALAAPAFSTSGLYSVLAAMPAKAVLASAVVVATAGGVTVADAVSQPAPPPVVAPADPAGDALQRAATRAAGASTRGSAGKADAAGGDERAGTHGMHTDPAAAKAAGLAKAAAAPDNAGAHKDAGLAKAAAAPHGHTAGQSRASDAGKQHNPGDASARERGAEQHVGRADGRATRALHAPEPTAGG